MAEITSNLASPCTYALENSAQRTTTFSVGERNPQTLYSKVRYFNSALPIYLEPFCLRFHFIVKEEERKNIKYLMSLFYFSFRPSTIVPMS